MKDTPTTPTRTFDSVPLRLVVVTAWLLLGSLATTPAQEDYGDAPDGTPLEYPFVPPTSGSFPTTLFTTNARLAGFLGIQHDVTDRIWLGGAAGTTIQRGHEPAKEWPSPFVQLIAPNRWWTLFFNGDHSDDYRMYVDVISPATWPASDRVEMVDLDLDVVLPEALGQLCVRRQRHCCDDQQEQEPARACQSEPPRPLG